MSQYQVYKPLRYKRVYTMIGLLMIGLVIWVSLARLTDVPEFQSSDKVGHLLAYMVLALWHSQFIRPRWPMILCCLALIALGLGIEWAQSLTAYRQAEWGDAIANTTGVLIGAALGLSPLGRALARLERGPRQSP